MKTWERATHERYARHGPLCVKTTIPSRTQEYSVRYGKVTFVLFWTIIRTTQCRFMCAARTLTFPRVHTTPRFLTKFRALTAQWFGYYLWSLTGFLIEVNHGLCTALYSSTVINTQSWNWSLQWLIFAVISIILRSQTWQSTWRIID